MVEHFGFLIFTLGVLTSNIDLTKVTVRLKESAKVKGTENFVGVVEVCAVVMLVKLSSILSRGWHKCVAQKQLTCLYYFITTLLFLPPKHLIFKRSEKKRN